MKTFYIAVAFFIAGLTIGCVIGYKTCKDDIEWHKPCTDLIMQIHRDGYEEGFRHGTEIAKYKE
jgi:hypothetical protein